MCRPLEEGLRTPPGRAGAGGGGPLRPELGRAEHWALPRDCFVPALGQALRSTGMIIQEDLENQGEPPDSFRP